MRLKTKSKSKRLKLNHCKAGKPNSQIELDEEGLIMNEVISMFKVPVVKRKADKSEKSSKSKSSADELSVFSYGEAEVVESMGREARKETGYSLERVKKSLSSTKGKRNAVVNDIFPDSEISIDSAKFLMKQRGEGCLSNQDIHRLKKVHVE